MNVIVLRYQQGDIISLTHSLEGAVLQASAADLKLPSGHGLTLEMAQDAITRGAIQLVGADAAEASLEVHAVEA